MSRAAPSVARVLLLADPSRHAELVGWLAEVEDDDVIGEARYDVHVAAPSDECDPGVWDVVVIDGESLPDARARLVLLRRVAVLGRRASVLYVCGRSPLEAEIEEAHAWVDDLIEAGWGEAVQRRVRLVALAPWRRSMSLRRHAEQQGDARLAVLPGGRDASPFATTLSHVDPAYPFTLLERAHEHGASPQMVAEAFHAGRRAGVGALHDRTERILEGLEDELDATEAELKSGRVDEDDASTDPLLLCARLGGARGAIEALRGELRRMARHQLAVIARRGRGER
ncbi:MAG: hypothetical protein AB7S26_28955 [Sandaracinaceae bacterium]